MPTRNINLTDHYEDFVSEQLTSGQFKNASEVVRAGLGLLERQQREYAAKLDALRTATALGVEAHQRGDYTALADEKSLDDFFEKIAQETDK